MKNTILILTLFIFSIIKVSATEQIPDLLIIEKDTFYLETFPLDDFARKNKVNIAPFQYGNCSFPSTNCWRGYKATWKVIDNKLFLFEIIKVDSTKEKLDIENYFKSINYSPQLINGLVFANWFSNTLKRNEKLCYYPTSELFFLSVDYLKDPNKKNELTFENGILSSNNIESLFSYKEGVTLTKEISFYRQWFLNRGRTKVDAVILENNGKMVRVEIKDFGTTKKSALKEIKSMMNIKEGQEYWINPRYWDKKNE